MTSPTYDLTSRMTEQIARSERDGDRRAIFLACYRLMTANMLRGVAHGRFRDRRWVGALIKNFAEYYFVALDAYEGGRGPSPPSGGAPTTSPNSPQPPLSRAC
jgi:hypothetical protein